MEQRGLSDYDKYLGESSNDGDMPIYRFPSNIDREEYLLVQLNKRLFPSLAFGRDVFPGL